MGQPDDVAARAADRSLVIWRARPTVRSILPGVAMSVGLVAVAIAGHLIFPTRWSYALGGYLVGAINLARTLIAAVRGRVRLEPDALEVRRLLTRRYPWSSLKSLTMDESGRIEITPNGWVRTLPIPFPDSELAFRKIRVWQRKHGVEV